LNRRDLLKAATAVGSLALAGCAAGGGASPADRPRARLPARDEFVVRGAYVLTMDPGLGDLPTGDIHVRDGQIVAVGKDLGTSAPALDGRGMIAMPGFVETHWHLWNSSLRALVRGDDAQNGYFPVTLRYGPLFTPEDSYRAVRLGVAEALSSGITTVHDWSHNVLTPQHADAELSALRDMGVRARFSYGNGQGQPLDRPMNLADVARVQREWGQGDPLLTLGVAIRTPAANPRGVTPVSVLVEEWAGARQLGLPITIHTRPGAVALLEQHGLLGPDVQLVHPQGSTPEEIKVMAARRPSFSTAPMIEMHYAQAARGVIQFSELQEAGIQQSLSIDSSAASANADFFNVMRALMWSHKQRFGARVPLSPRRVLELATIDGARDLKLADKVGSLVPGKRADMILVRTTGSNIAPVIDPATALVFSAQPANVDTVIVDGRILRRGGRFTSLDHEQVVRDATQSINAMRARLPI
jgi:cytosine/adenosine deaminase-related metal-dependent hydrolase